MPGKGTVDLPDGELLARIASGDQEAYEAFLDRHQGAVCRFLKAHTASEADCEDALQETFIAALRGAGSFRGDASARSWVLGIARNVCRRAYRRRVGEPEEIVSLEELGLKAGWGGAPPSDTFLESLERRDTLEKALARLMPEEREILILRELEELSGEETAALLELSIPAMKSRLHRARLRLAAALGEGNHG